MSRGCCKADFVGEVLLAGLENDLDKNFMIVRLEGLEPPTF